MSEKIFWEALDKNDFSKIEKFLLDVPEMIEEKTPVVINSTPYLIVLVKFIAAILFHYKFEPEMRNALAMMKFAIMHSTKFESYILAFLMGLIDYSAIILLEFGLLWNLSNLQDNSFRQLMFDFIALGIVAEFDDYFAEIYRYSNVSGLIFGAAVVPLVITNTIMPKRKKPSIKSEKIEEKLALIRRNLKKFRSLCKDEQASLDDDKEVSVRRQFKNCIVHYLGCVFYFFCCSTWFFSQQKRR